MCHYIIMLLLLYHLLNEIKFAWFYHWLFCQVLVLQVSDTCWHHRRSLFYPGWNISWWYILGSTILLTACNRTISIFILYMHIGKYINAMTTWQWCSKCSSSHDNVILGSHCHNAGLNFKGCRKRLVSCREEVNYFLMTILNVMRCMGKDRIESGIRCYYFFIAYYISSENTLLLSCQNSHGVELKMQNIVFRDHG